MKLAAIAVLLAAPAFQEKNEAEELFKALRAKLTAAKTLKLKFTFDDGRKTAGSAAWAEGNKVRVESADPLGFTRTFVCDGKKAVDQTGESKPQVVEAWPTLAKDALECFLRYDLYVSFNVGIGLGWILDKTDLFKRVRLSEFKVLPDEKLGDRPARKIQFERAWELAEGVDPNRERVTLWIDRETGLPLKREWASIQHPDSKPMSELYSDVEIDGKVDPKVFEIP